MNKAHLTYVSQTGRVPMKTCLMPPLQWGLTSKRVVFTYLLLPSHKMAKYWGGYIKICSVSAIKHCIKRSSMILIKRLEQNI